MALSSEILEKLGTRALLPTAVVGAAAIGFAQGLGSQDNSSAFYELATGNPNIDQEVLGTNAGVRELFLPAGPLNRFRYAQGAGISPFGNLGRLAVGAVRGTVNGVNITDHFANKRQPLSNNLRYSNRPPQVDGSLVFGQYNSRYGA